MLQENKFYTYILFDPRFKGSRDKNKPYNTKGVPFYVGKGHGLRAYSHLGLKDGTRNSEKDRLIKSIRRAGLEPVVYFVKRNLPEGLAHAWERYWIARLGRKDRGTGPLLNRCDGGQGNAGNTWNPIRRLKHEITIGLREPEVRAKISHRASSTMHAWWSSLTLRQRRAHKQKMLRGQAERPEEKKLRSRKKMSESGRARVARLTAEEKALHSKKTGIGNKRAWDSYTPKQRENRGSSISAYHAKMDPKFKEELYTKVSNSAKAYHASMTDKERAARSQAVRAGMLADPIKHQRMRAKTFLAKKLRSSGRYNEVRHLCLDFIDRFKFQGNESSWNSFTHRASKFLASL